MPTEKRFCLEEYDEELKKQEIVLDIVMEAEELTKKEKNELWNGSSDEEKTMLITVKESEVFVMLMVSDDDDDRTIQGEEDILKPH
ncbi:hypothetical protein F8M41_013607 [Gigaspora margarita]|uniref:Uncharacterized protein n=1 Tax=Gigaspora margarita TaxID=4874 RepID=A0A8H4ASE5_GIGMA|nr:hypothetical protein F8M41_013607 [Gigaspora margarita]